MHTFVDGPAAGVKLSCARAPLFLRVTHEVDGSGTSTFDALDQLSDKPKPSEAVHVYIKAKDHGSVHYCGRGKDGKRFGRTEQMADYRLYQHQPDDIVLRHNPAWQAWCALQYEAMKTEQKEAGDALDR
jgi:hypothetical protein